MQAMALCPSHSVKILMTACWKIAMVVAADAAISTKITRSGRGNVGALLFAQWAPDRSGILVSNPQISRSEEESFGAR